MKRKDFLTTTVLLSTGDRVEVKYTKIAGVEIQVSGTIKSITPTHFNFKGNRLNYSLSYRRIISIRKEVQSESVR